MPDIAIVDWNMPVMNGIEFVRELRKVPNGTAPKVVMCTTEGETRLKTLTLLSSSASSGPRGATGRGWAAGSFRRRRSNLAGPAG